MYLSPVNPDDVLALLHALEWAGTDPWYGVGCCPIWEANETRHAPTCRLRAMIHDLSTGVTRPTPSTERHHQP